MNIRAANGETDVLDILRICNLCEPAFPVSEGQVRGWFRPAEPGRTAFRLVAERNGAAVGFACVIHAAEAPAGLFFAWVGVDPAFRCQGIGSALWNASLALLTAQNASLLTSEVVDNDPVGLAFAERRGFAIDRHKFHSTLHLTTFDETPYLPAIAALEAQGIHFCTLADFPQNQEAHDKFCDLNEAVVRDIPGEYWDFNAYPAFFDDHIWNAPWFFPQNQLLAVDGDAWVGFAGLSMNPEKHSAYNATTGVIREYRGRKIALALKVLAARCAREQGAREISTDNDSLNAPMLAINRKLGYQPEPGKYTMMRKMALR